MRTLPIIAFSLATALLAGCGHAPAGVAPMTAAAQALHAQSAPSQRPVPVEQMLGIGQAYGAKLRGAGVTDTGALLAATDTTYKRHKLADATGIPYDLVVHMSEQASLMRVDGVGVREANLLCAVGVNSMAELAQRDPQSLANRVTVANAFAPHFVDRTPSVQQLAQWIGLAKLTVAIDKIDGQPQPAPSPSTDPNAPPPPAGK